MSNAAVINEQAVLSNLQTHNAELIKQGISKEERFTTLLTIAQYQTRVLSEAEMIQSKRKGA
jgi:hypothetical protein